MTPSKILIAATLLSIATVSSASAQQLPTWANSNPDAFQAQYPGRDALNGGALTPAGRMGLERANGAAPAFNAYEATGRADASSHAELRHSYDPASGAFLGYDGRRHVRE